MKCATVLGVIIASLSFATDGWAEDVELVSQDGTQTCGVSLDAEPGTSRIGWGLGSTLAALLESQGMPDSVEFGELGRPQILRYAESWVRLDARLRVLAWMPSDPYKLARYWHVRWTRGKGFVGTAADVMDVMGEPTWPAESPRVWKYGQSWFQFDEQGQLVDSRNHGELVWSKKAKTRYLERRLSAEEASARMAAIREAREKRREQVEKLFKALGEVAEAMNRDANARSSVPAPAQTGRPVLLCCVSGLDVLSANQEGKLGGTAGVRIKSLLGQNGFQCWLANYANNEDDYRQMLYDVQTAHARGADIVLVAHSQGGVWAHAATRQLPSVQFRALIDLDTSSYGWAVRLMTTPTIGNPRNAVNGMDLEDVVFANVGLNLEIRSGASPLGGEWFDEQDNVRVPDGTRRGITTHITYEAHRQVHRPGSGSMQIVEAWVQRHIR